MNCSRTAGLRRDAAESKILKDIKSTVDIIRRSQTQRETQAASSSPEEMGLGITGIQGAASDSSIDTKRGPLPLFRVPKGLGSSLRALSDVKEHRTLAALILLFLLNAWLLNLVVHADWLPVLFDELKWLANPTLNIPDIHPSLLGLVAIVQALFIGTLVNMVLLPREEDWGLKRIAAVGLGLGLVGWTAMLLSIVEGLDRININLAIFLLLCILIYLGFARDGFVARRFVSDLRNAFGIWAIGKRRPNLGEFAFFGSLIALAGIEYYHATSAPILHWDALVYHATMAKLIFRQHGIPLIAGPSVGIEMSANYPPLYPSLGAFFYTQVGAVDDLYLRLISPTAGLLTTFIVYKTASQLGSRLFARVATLLLALSPLFIVTAISAINYMLATFFFAATLFFLTRAIIDNQTGHWAAAGITLGLGFTTTYQAYFLLPAFGAALVIALWRTDAGQRSRTIGNILVALGLTLTVGGIWYLRNFIVVGDPIFPFAPSIFHGMNIDVALLQRSIEGIHADSVYDFFGTFSPTALDLPRFVLLNRSHFPVISVLSMFGLGLALLQKERTAWAIVLAFSLVPLVIVSSTVANIFTRYFIFSFPGLALVSALPIAKAVEWSAARSDRAPIAQAVRVGHRMRKPQNPAIIGAVVGFLAATAVFPSSLAIIAGQAYQEGDWVAPNDSFRLLAQPGQDQSQVLAAVYGTEPKMWQWLNQRLGDAKVATFENKIYYIKDSYTSAFFYLDGWEARELYGMTNPGDIVQYLSQHNVQYVLDPSWVRHWVMYNQLPMNRYLGMPQYFPLLEGSPADSAIYHVGPIDSAVTKRSQLAISYLPEGLASSGPTGETLTIPEGIISPRLYIQDPGNGAAITVQIDYLDRGKGDLTVNRWTQEGWDYGVGIAAMSDSGATKTLRFTIPGDSFRGYEELGLHAQSTDVLITRVGASQGR